MDELDITAAESEATYEKIKAYVAEYNDGMKVSNLYIAQVKAKYGIIETLRYFQMIPSETQDDSAYKKERI